MLQCTQQGDALTVHLCGEIDHCAAEGLRNEIEMQIVRQNAKRLILDFSQVTFMDSSGVGMIIGRYKTMHARGGSVAACGLQPPIDRLFHLAGLHRIIAITETEGRKTHE
ncbi:MAG: anti-sigma factor antagonist [Clostridiales bacterium]|nr:anti-sigma factor antagonist [Clostridiales bacterium]